MVKELPLSNYAESAWDSCSQQHFLQHTTRHSKSTYYVLSWKQFDIIVCCPSWRLYFPYTQLTCSLIGYHPEMKIQEHHMWPWNIGQGHCWMITSKITYWSVCQFVVTDLSIPQNIWLVYMLWFMHTQLQKQELCLYLSFCTPHLEHGLCLY